MPIKILIADCMIDFAQMVAKTFANEADLEVVGCTEDGCEALEMVKALHPDVLLSDVVLPGLDGLHLMRLLEESDLAKKPKVIFISSVAYPAMFAEARSLHAYYFMMKPVSLDALIGRTRAAGCTDKTVPPDLGSYDTKSMISAILKTLGTPLRLLGFRYLQEAIRLSLKDKNAARSVTKSIYPSVAKAFSTTSSRVERNIEYAIKLTWQHASEEDIATYFGNTGVHGGQKPTVSEFVAAIADYIDAECAYTGDKQ